MKASHDQIQSKLQEIKEEMQRTGMWQGEPLDASRHQFIAPFARDTMTFSQWLQFVFFPQVEEILDTYDTLPKDSAVGTIARTQYKNQPEVQRLVELLSEFDALLQARQNRTS
jgi:uncharacterized protein YqcC (DUF446 family)